ncbi:MAG TPA: hypothetical protein VIJ15_15435 [Dermatophilaceae bacterium]
MRRSFVAALALTLGLAACSSGGTTSGPTASSTGIRPSASSGPPTGSGPSTGAGTATSTASPQGSSGSATSAQTSFAYVPLWPFGSVAAAQAWQREAAAGGHQPWRLDAGEVAVAFARQYLGFTEIDHVVRRTVTADDAHVTVGYTVAGATGTAGVIHLVRIGSGAGRPWEVVGTDDTVTFSLTRPRYGSTVAGAITVGGRIAGVDESIRVTARQPSGIVAGYCCLPAGAPVLWSVPLRLPATLTGPLTIVASTGGHLAAVERFAVTGVHSGR